MRTIFMAFAGIFLGASAVMAAEPIASTDGETPGTAIKVQELKIVSGALMLKFVIENNSDKPISLYSLLNSSEGDSVDGIYLLDVPGKKKYLVVRDSDGHCLCSRSIKREMAPNTSAAYWAKFPTLPDSVQKIGIIAPHFMPMDDVPIAR